MKSWIRITMVAGLILCAASVAMAQPGGRGQGGRGGQGRGGFGGFPGNRGGLALLQDESVRKDLGVTDDQMKKLAEFQTRSRGEMREAFQGLRDLSAEERTAKFQELQKKTAEATAAAEKEILLPKQIERLKQISLQSRLNRDREVWRSDDLAKELGITDAQKEALRKAQEEADAEVQTALNKLREEARQKVLGVLTADQRAKLKSLTGEPIQFAPRGRGGPGAAGGAGGTGGQGRRGGAGGRPARGD